MQRIASSLMLPMLPAEELRSVSHLKNPQDQARLTEALALARQLAVSYVGLTLYMDMFPQVSQRGVSHW